MLCPQCTLNKILIKNKFLLSFFFFSKNPKLFYLFAWLGCLPDLSSFLPPLSLLSSLTLEKDLILRMDWKKMSPHALVDFVFNSSASKCLRCSIHVSVMVCVNALELQGMFTYIILIFPLSSRGRQIRCIILRLQQDC